MGSLVEGVQGEGVEFLYALKNLKKDLDLNTQASWSEKLSWPSIITPKLCAVLVGVNEDAPSWMLIFCGIAGLAGNTRSSVFE